MRSSLSFAVGMFFALGLGLSGMVNPNKVLNFLDLSGQWDPSLALVMLGAVGINLLFFPFILKRSRPLMCSEWHVPANRRIDATLIAGALIFGVGWGLAGFCPGPALVTLAFGKFPVVVFVASMITGMILCDGLGLGDKSNGVVRRLHLVQSKSTEPFSQEVAK